ncbi:aldose epimerase family protein [Paraglaciecola hydrolytica]|uniref:Aldose 1-epimerase n=1 Tax=Paraglaciecola hydrolytica TaxID=1799789 RepID=A0A148KLE9_9ALTE|nr:aldose epimerase family protein [Paraglaciecola hydrolytica]KXI27136.1 galactose mutarotase [Paraglaciecola hydrolytica]
MSQTLLSKQHTSPLVSKTLCIRALTVALAALFLSACNPAGQSTSQTSSEKTAVTEQTMKSTKFAADSKPYGQLADGTQVDMITLSNPNGIEVDVISYGGIITRLLTPDAQGQLGDIVLGFDNLDDYVSASPYFGALIGRYGNRIANGRFELNGETYQLDTNDGANHLHGGVQGFDKKVWAMQPFTTDNSAGIVLTLLSPDGDQGYPGNLAVEVTYELTADNQLDMRFKANTDKATVVNLTQHTYFNLAGKDDILAHQMQINSATLTPVGAGLIPTGELSSVEGTPFDFRQPKAIGKDIRVEDAQLALGLGYDHNYVVKAEPSEELVLAATVSEPTTGRVLEVWSEEPSVQFYSGNFLDGSLQGKGRTFGHRSGFCLEPQHNPDSPNQPQFPTTTLLPEDTYQTRIVYRFATQ